MAKKVTLLLDYGQSLLSPLEEIDRPDLIIAALSLHSKTNADIKDQIPHLYKFIADYIRAQEESHFKSMAISMGIVKRHGGLLPQFDWHDGWQRDLLVKLASDRFPRFAGKRPPQRGAPKKPVDVDLIFEVIQRTQHAGSEYNACKYISQDSNTQWHQVGQKALYKRYNRAKVLWEKSRKQSNRERFNAFIRMRLGLPDKSS